MKQKIITACIAIGAFLLGLIMPRAPKIQETIVTEIIRDTIKHTELVSVPIKVPETKIEYVYVSKADTVWMHDTVWIKIPRQHYYSETDDVKIWHSGIDSRIDSLINIRETHTITKICAEPWKRNSISAYGEVGYCNNLQLLVGAKYQYEAFKWMSLYADAGYDLYWKQPYVKGGLKITIYCW